MRLNNKISVPIWYLGIKYVIQNALRTKNDSLNNIYLIYRL